MIQVRETFSKAKEWEKETLQQKFGDDLGIRLAFSDADELAYKPLIWLKLTFKRFY